MTLLSFLANIVTASSWEHPPGSQLRSTLHGRPLHAQAELLRTTCAVLVRRVITPSSPHWDRLDDAMKTGVRAGLLSALGKETSPPVARKVSNPCVRSIICIFSTRVSDGVQ